MSVVGVVRPFVGLWRAERLQNGALRALQARRLLKVVGHAYATVPFWTHVMDRAGIRPEAVRSLEDLASFPITTRTDLQQVPLPDLTSSAVPPDQLQKVTTTGSTGRPLTIHIERRYLDLRKAMFLRALMASGFWPGETLMLLAHERGRVAPPWLRWRYVDPDLPPAALHDTFASWRPANLYGWVTPLRLISEQIRADSGSISRPRRVFTTAEAVDEATAKLLDAHLGGERYAIYGSTELGPMGWECPAHQGLHLGEDTTILEFLPVPGGGGLCRIIATSLHSMATPMIRYDTGDLGWPPESAPCVCGRRLPRLQRLEGRLVDVVRLKGGGLLSPFVLTEAVETVPDLQRYQIIQEDLGRFTVRAEGRPADPSGTGVRIVGAVRKAVGSPVDVEVRWAEQLDPPAGSKYRVVVSRLA